MRNAFATPEKIKSITKIKIVLLGSTHDNKLDIFYTVFTAPEIIR